MCPGRLQRLASSPRIRVTTGEQIFFTPLEPCHELTAPLLLCDQPRVALTLTAGGIIDVLWVGNWHGQQGKPCRFYN